MLPLVNNYDTYYKQCIFAYFGKCIRTIKRKYKPPRRKIVKDRLYRIWVNMHTRCKNQKHKSYKDYGGRGITICKEWCVFENFKNWAMKDYQDHLTIDRKENNGNYCPDNCRWTTMKEQQNNRNNNRRLTIFGKTQTLTQWSEEYKISIDVIKYRIERNWSLEDCVSKPIMKSKSHKVCI